MTKAELVEAVAAGSGLSRAQAARGIDALGNAAACALIAGQDVSLPGLGKFRRKMIGARPGRNPQTGEALTIPAHHKAVFSPAAVLKEAVK